MPTRKPSKCKACGGEVERRRDLTNRGYHLECGIAREIASVRDMTGDNDAALRAHLLKIIVGAQRRLRELDRVSVDTDADVA